MLDVTHFARFPEECIRLAHKQVYSRDTAWLMVAIEETAQSGLDAFVAGAKE